MTVQYREFIASGTPNFQAVIVAWLNGIDTRLERVWGSLSGGDNFHIWAEAGVGHDSFSMGVMDVNQAKTALPTKLGEGRATLLGWNVGNPASLWYLEKV